MKSRRFSLAFVAALSLSLIYAFLLSSLMKTGACAPAPTENSPFKGKLMVVQMDAQYSVALWHAEVRKLGDRWFLVGKGSKSESWTQGRMTWVPMTRITEIVEFESEEEMKKAWEEYQKVNLGPPRAKAPPQAGREEKGIEEKRGSGLD